MKTLLLFFILSFTTLFSFSQHIEVGGEAGYVTSSLASNGFKVSAITNFYPKHAIFYIGSGLSYQKENEWNFIKLPVGITFCPGRKVKLLIGIGVSVSYVILQPKYRKIYDVLSLKDVMLSSCFSLGMSIQVAKKWRILIKPQFDLGLTHLYKTYYGSYGQDWFNANSISINSGVTYSF
jgi:hypothetical protein